MSAKLDRSTNATSPGEPGCAKHGDDDARLAHDGAFITTLLERPIPYHVTTNFALIENLVNGTIPTEPLEIPCLLRDRVARDQGVDKLFLMSMLNRGTAPVIGRYRIPIDHREIA